jgi:predicted ATPase
VLTGGARDLPPRQQTLHDTIAWSYDLLNLDEQRLFRRLAVFAGGCTLDAAEAICRPDLVCIETGADSSPPKAAGDQVERQRVLDGLASLVDKSLIYQDVGPDGEPRFLVLETIRQFALEQLVAHGEGDALRKLHAGYYLAMVEATGALLFAAEHERMRAASEQDNMLAALHWWMQHG